MTNERVEQLKQSWENDSRWTGIKRTYTAEEVIKLRGSIDIEHTLARRGSEKLWNLLKQEDFINALGALTGNQAMQHFGSQNYKYCVKFDFDRTPELNDVFAITKQPERLLKELSAYCNAPLLPEETLIIFDEIQECEEALNSLKYFYEDAPQYHIMAAGSLLGVAVRRHE